MRVGAHDALVLSWAGKEGFCSRHPDFSVLLMSRALLPQGHCIGFVPTVRNSTPLPFPLPSPGKLIHNHLLGLSLNVASLEKPARALQVRTRDALMCVFSWCPALSLGPTRFQDK